MKRSGIALLAGGMIAALALGLFAYTKVLAKFGSGTPPQAVAAHLQADRILVSKADHTLKLLRGARLLKTYPIVMGRNWDAGHKQREGDERTPEGAYVIDWRNARSMAYLSLHISYPNAADRQAARQGRYSPGGHIMIHGLPNGWGSLAQFHRLLNWTDGCIAVTNAEMDEIWSLVPNGTPIEITAGSTTSAVSPGSGKSV